MMMMMCCGSSKLVIQALDKIREGRMQEQLGIDLSSDKWILQQQQQLPRNYYGLQQLSYHGVFIHEMLRRRRRRRRRPLSPTDTDPRAVDDCATAFSIGPPRNFECYPNCWATVNQRPPAHREGWMISGQETVFCWIPVH